MVMAGDEWQFDPAHSSVGFWARHLLVSKVRGRFARWSGKLVFDAQALGAAQASVEIDAASIDTHDGQRDAHLRSPDFLDAARHPVLMFVSTRVVETRGRAFQVTGDLTMRGVTRPVTLEVVYRGHDTQPQQGERIRFSARGALHRKDFGLTWSPLIEAGGLAVSDKIMLEFEIEATRSS
jgi:polyisoprenoid-binding protein YceI